MPFILLLFIIVAIVGTIFGVGLWSAVFVVVMILACVGLLAWLLTPACPHCGSKRGSSHIYQRMDGKADMRYRYNPIRCSSCGENIDPFG